MGVSHRKGDFILNVVWLFLDWVCKGSKHYSILDQLLSTVETILGRFDLKGKTTTFAACPMCHYTYPPTFISGSTVPEYPITWKNCPYPDSDPCSSPILKDSVSDDRIPSSKPYIVADFHDYLANLLSQKDLESVMDHRCDDVMVSIWQDNQPPNYVSDVFNAKFIRTFEGPQAGKLFIDRPGHEGQYLFAININFFASECMTLQGANTSSGVITAVASIYLLIFVINVNICILLLSSLAQMSLVRPNWTTTLGLLSISFSIHGSSELISLTQQITLLVKTLAALLLL